jgi:hypothetical protein
MNNQAALGYTIGALKGIGFSSTEINTIITEMKFQMDIATEHEAEQLCLGFVVEED